MTNQRQCFWTYACTAHPARKPTGWLMNMLRLRNSITLLNWDGTAVTWGAGSEFHVKAEDNRSCSTAFKFLKILLDLVACQAHILWSLFGSTTWKIPFIGLREECGYSILVFSNSEQICATAHWAIQLAQMYAMCKQLSTHYMQWAIVVSEK